jgi:hypothetical protein
VPIITFVTYGRGADHDPRVTGCIQWQLTAEAV